MGDLQQSQVVGYAATNPGNATLSILPYNFQEGQIECAENVTFSVIG